MRKGRCIQFKECQKAESNEVQEIADYSPFECSECQSPLQEIHEVKSHKALPKWFYPSMWGGIGLAIILSLVFLWGSKPEIKKVEPVKVDTTAKAPPPPEYIYLTNSQTENVLTVPKASVTAIPYVVGPFVCNVTADSVYWEKMETQNMVVLPEDGSGANTNVKFFRKKSDLEGYVKIKVTPVKKGFVPKPSEIYYRYKINIPTPSVSPGPAVQYIKVVTSGKNFDISGNQRSIAVPESKLLTYPAASEGVTWQLNRARSTQGLSYSVSLDKGMGSIPAFQVTLPQSISSARIVFDVVPMKAGFTPVKSSIVYSFSGSGCPPPETVNDLNTRYKKSINDFREYIYMMATTNDLDLKQNYKDNALAKIKEIPNCRFESSSGNIFAFLNSNFSKNVVVETIKDECGLIKGVKIK